MRAVFVRLIAIGASVLLAPLATPAFAAPADDTAKQAPAVQQAPAAQQAKQDTEKAADAPDEATDAKTPDAATEDKRICRSVKLDASSRRKTKVCRTVEEWRELNNPS